MALLTVLRWLAFGEAFAVTELWLLKCPGLFWLPFSPLLLRELAFFKMLRLVLLGLFRELEVSVVFELSIVDRVLELVSTFVDADETAVTLQVAPGDLALEGARSLFPLLPPPWSFSRRFASLSSPSKKSVKPPMRLDSGRTLVFASCACDALCVFSSGFASGCSSSLESAF